ncbi:MAG: hypothetical protein U1E76_00320 [Planctomycetota bacterium]
MSRSLAALRALSRRFGARAAAAKLRLLEQLLRAPPRAAHRLRAPLDFMRAYPDSAAVRARVHELLARLPGVVTRSYPYSYGVVQRLVALLPHAVEIDWDASPDPTALGETLSMLVTPGEAQGVEDITIPYREWFRRARPEHAPSDIAFFVALLEGSGLSRPWQAHVYDRMNLPLRYRGPASTALALDIDAVCYQRASIARSRTPIAARICAPLAPPERGSRAIVDLALQALCARKLEIYPLIHGNADDVHLVRCARGVTIALIGVLPEFRSPLETLVFFLVLKNGVPMAYGPAGVFLGCCEMGINLFPEFRGAEIRFVYTQFMRVLHHVLGVDYFFLTRYGMGEGNDEAIASGAFWFYRKLGFTAANPEVEALARLEERRMAARPGYRSDARMLRRLAHTEAYLDLSNGRCQPFDFGGLGLAQSQFLAREFDGDRALAEAQCTARIRRWLGRRVRGTALGGVAPILGMLPDLASFTAAERRALAGLIAAKGARSELPAARQFARHERLVLGLRALAQAGRR